MTDTQSILNDPADHREHNAFVGMCTECGLEDSLAVSNAEELPEEGDVVAGYVCDCENTEWTATGEYDNLVFQRESRFALGPDISGSYYNYAHLEWVNPLDGDYLRPECPVKQLGSTDKPVGCTRTAERLTMESGKGAWKCPWHGTFRAYDYPRATADTEQASLSEVRA